MQQQVLAPFNMAGKILEVGGGDIPMRHDANWITMDMRKLPTVDYVGNMEEAWPFADGTFDGVFSKFAIEHCSWRKSQHFANECFRVLKPGGSTMAIGPDTLAQCREITRIGAITEKETALIFGGQEEPGWNEHKAAFSPDYAKEIFTKAGFTRVEIEPWPGQIWTGARTDMIIRAWKDTDMSIVQKTSTKVAPAPNTLAATPWFKSLDDELEKASHIRVNLGSFTVMFKGWKNIDILDVSQYANAHGFEFIKCDVKDGLPFKANSVEMIYSSHMFEHLTRPEIQAVLNDCNRVLKLNGPIRIAVPDLDTLVHLYAEGSLKKIITDNEGVNAAPDNAAAFWHILTDNHKTALDFPGMTNMLLQAGFTDIRKAQPGQSRNTVMQTETKDIFQNHSLYIEAVKTVAPTPIATKPCKIEAAFDKLKIGLISTQFFGCPPTGYSGLERVVWDLAVGLGRRGHEVTLFAPEGSQAPPNGRLVVTGPALTTTAVDWRKTEEEAYDRYKGQLEDLNLDIVHGHGWYGMEYAYKAAHPKKAVCHTHHGHIGDTAYWLAKPPFKLNFITLSDYMSREAFGQGMVNQFCYNGIDLDKYKYQEKKGDRLLFVGRLDVCKQPHVAIEIAKELGLGLDIFGGDFVSDRDYLGKIVAACDGKQIVLHLDSPQHEKVAAMQNARCLLMPSNFKEPWGLVAAEAMACGTPVVALNDGAISEVVENGVSGWVCKTKNDMKQIVASGEILIKPAACRTRGEKFSLEIMAEKYEELYKQIIYNDEQW
jgi:predicted SAM-dependent methyltransferase/glycosyltransferase involved in cell wall biosynthesis